MDEMRIFIILPLFYLTMTSGLPPGRRLMEAGNNSSILMDGLGDSSGGGGGNFSTTAGTLIPEDPPPESSLTAPPPPSLDTTTISPPTTNSIIDSISYSSGTSPDGSSQELMHHFATDNPVISPLVQNITKVPLRGKCYTSGQCIGEWTECRYNVCRCISGYLPRIDNGDLCGEESLHHVQLPQTDPTMIGVVIGLALMSVTLCVVLRLFAKARFRENRTIFNTPNPRLMNVSLLKGGSKSLIRGNSAPRSRRGSTVSARSGPEPGTPTSPTHHHPHHHHLDQLHIEEGQQSGNGSGGSPMPLAGSSRPKPTRQMSTDTTGDSTPTTRPASAVNKQRFRHQDSVASNV